MKKVVSLAAVFCLSSMPVLAGGLSPEIVEAPVAAPVVQAVPVAGGAMGNTGLIAAGVGVLLLAALVSSSSSSPDTPDTPDT